MPRIRSIKPETFEDELLGKLPREVRLLYIGLWTLSDDEGRFRASPGWVRSSLFPYDEDLTPHEVGSWLATLAAEERIHLYEVAGQQYGVVVRWRQHQKISHPGTSRLPAPPQSAKGKFMRKERKSSRGTPESSGDSPGVLATDRDKDRDKEEDRDLGQGVLPVPVPPVPAGRKPKADPNRDYKRVVDGFHARYRSFHDGRKPTWNNVSGAIVKGLLSQHSADEILRRADVLFSPGCPDFVARGGRDLKAFAAHFDKLAAPARGTPRPPVVNQAFRDLAHGAGVDFDADKQPIPPALPPPEEP